MRSRPGLRRARRVRGSAWSGFRARRCTRARSSTCGRPLLLRGRRGGGPGDRRPPRRGGDRGAWRRRRLAGAPAARGGWRSGAPRGAGGKARRGGRVAARLREARAGGRGRASGGGMGGVEAVLHEPRLRRGGGDDLRGDRPQRGRGLRARPGGANRDREVAARRARRSDRGMPRLEVADRPPHAARTPS